MAGWDNSDNQKDASKREENEDTEAKRVHLRKYKCSNRGCACTRSDTEEAIFSCVCRQGSLMTVTKVITVLQEATARLEQTEEETESEKL